MPASPKPGSVFSLTLTFIPSGICLEQRLIQMMKHNLFAILGTCLLAANTTAGELGCFELRTYTARDGKLEALHNRFRSHTIKLFEKHGMVNIGYWTPQENAKRQLIYLLGYPDRQARDQAWKQFFADPAWKKAYNESIANGRLVEKVDALFLVPTDYSPKIRAAAASPRRTFELRTYTATPNNLGNLHARFRDHTLALFEKHGMVNFGYFQLMPGQPGAEKTLVYILAHKNRQATKDAFATFVKDPKWIAAKQLSEENAGGRLTVRGGIASFFMNPTDYSSTQ